MFKMSVESKVRIFDEKPQNCPFCHKSIVPKEVNAILSPHNYEIAFICPNIICGRVFIGYYNLMSVPTALGPAYKFIKTNIGTTQSKIFSNEILIISPSFSTIYNQAYFAEQHELLEICGVGYRKALEYLIKDYAIKLHPNESERIKKIALSDVIKQYIKNQNIKDVASRAAWLGNDETHYVRKWEALDVQHLKKLIDLCIHWIESEELTKSFIDEMPETGPK